MCGWLVILGLIQLSAFSGVDLMKQFSLKGYISRIKILTFISHNPNNLDKIYSVLSDAQYLAEKLHLGNCPVTCDQPIYIKAAEVVQSTPHPIKLGGFHLVMSYMGSISNIKSLGYSCSKLKS